MKSAELTALKRILPDYVGYLKRNPFSMLVKIYGMFTLKRPLMKPIKVMLMENTIQAQNPERLIAIYDLKGSSHGR